MKHSGHNKGTSGWYYIVRGSVQMVTVSQVIFHLFLLARLVTVVSGRPACE